MKICHVQTNIATNYPTEVNKTLNYPRAFPSPPPSSLKVNLRAVISKTTLRPFWCFAVVSWEDLTRDRSNETTESPDETAHHTYSFHPVLQTGISQAPEKRCWKRLFSWGSAWLFPSHWHGFHLQQHTYTQCVNLISLLLLLSLSPRCFSFYFSSATHIHRDKKNHVQSNCWSRQTVLKTAFTHLNTLRTNNIDKWSMRFIYYEFL